MSSLQKRKLKRGYTFILRFRDDSGRQHSISLRTNDLKTAKRIKDHYDAKRALELSGIESPKKRITLKEFTSQYLEYCRINKSKSTVQRDALCLSNLIKFTGDLPLGKVKPQLVEEYKSERSKVIKPTTVNIELRHLKAAFSRAVDWNFIEENPFRKVRLFRIQQKVHPQYMNDNQVKDFLSAITNPFHRALFYFMLCTACRKHEALELKWEDVDFEKRLILFRNTKNKKERLVPLRGSLRKTLLDLPKYSELIFGLEGSYVWRLFKRYLKKAGISNQFRVHDLRHTALTHIVDQSRDIISAKDIAGHSNISVTEIYTHAMPEKLRRAIEKLPY